MRDIVQSRIRSSHHNSISSTIIDCLHALSPIILMLTIEGMYSYPIAYMGTISSAIDNDLSQFSSY